MSDASFPWDELLALITREQRVVPILGQELCALPAEGGALFEEVAARRLGARWGMNLQGLPSLPRLAQELINQGQPKTRLCRELLAIHGELLAASAGALPDPLRHFAEVRDFPLVLTTNTDGLVAAALREARERAPGPIVAALGAVTDLPRRWDTGPKPTLYHLLGRIGAVPSFALTEEDVLEFLHRMQSEAQRPEQLFDELRTRHLLLVGVRFSNWTLRFFLRALHGTRLGEDTGQVIVLAGEMVRRDASLAGFLREVSRRVWIYEEGNAVEFMAELRRRWHAAHDDPVTTSSSPGGPREPEAMPDGAVYVSCARADRSAAERLAAVLDEAGLDVWFDRNDAPSGPRYENCIRQYIQRCDLFIPLLSPESGGQTDAFFRKEWQWAIERGETLENGANFLLPVALDAGTPPNIPSEFRKMPALLAPDGQAGADVRDACIAAVRQIRARRTS
jgi:hypothetical protein